MHKLSLVICLLIFLSGCTPNTPNLLKETANTEPIIAYQPTTMAYANEEWFDRYDIYQVNRLEPKASFYPFQDEETAYLAQKSALDDINYSISSRIISLNGQWEFLYTPLAQRLFPLQGVDHSQRYEYWDTSNFVTIDVPSTIQTIKDDDGNFLFEEPLYVNSTYPWLNYEQIQYGWDGLPTAATASNYVMHYKKTIEIPADYLLDVTQISFEGVLGAFYVYVNGNLVGYSEDSTCNAVFDISAFIHEGTNTIAVEVMKYADASYFENQDSIRTYGIYRDVQIITHPQNYLEDIETTQIFNDDGSVTLNTTVIAADPTKIQISLYDHDQKLIAEGSSITISEPSLWDYDHPYLYHLIVKTTNDDQPTEATMINIGLRNITFDENNVYINDIPIMFKGINRTETSLEGGRCLSDEQIIYDLTMMKQLNINAFRMAHYPNAKLTYDLADELGLYVIDEANIESHLGEQVLSMPANNPIFNPLLLDRTKNMVERDLNHPSVIIYSLGNESTYQEYPLDDNYGMYNNSRWILAKDPSRLRMYERDNRTQDSRETSMVDIASSQYYSLEQVKQANKEYDIPFVQQEFAHAMGNAIGNLQEYFDLYYQEEGLVGGFIWDMVDQSILTNDYFGYGNDWGQPLNDGDFCGNGILNADRSWQAESYEVKKVYQDIHFEFTDSSLTITNLFHTRDLSDVSFVLTYQIGEQIIQQNSFALTIDPGRSTTIDLDIPSTDQELIITIQAFVEQDEIAFEQHIMNEYAYPQFTDGRSSDIQITYDDTIDITYHDVHISDLTFDLYRAPVDNDPLFIPELADLKLDITTCKQQENKLTLKGTIQTLETPFELKFETSGNQLKITSKLFVPSINKIGEVANIGLTMKLSNNLETYSYYGKGPFENFTDRNTSAKLNVYTETIDEYFNTKFLKPQTSNYKSDVRYLDIGNISFTMLQPMNIQVTHYDDMEITQASHFTQLSPKDYVIVNLDLYSRGLGNASLDVEPLDKYIIKQDKYYTFETLITFN